MRNKIIALILSGLLSACAAGGLVGPDVSFENLSPKAKVYVLKSSFDLQLDALKSYRQQPRCSDTVVVGCYDPGTYDRLVEAAVAVDAALDAAEAAVDAGGDNAAALIAVSRRTLNSFINELVVSEVK